MDPRTALHTAPADAHVPEIAVLQLHSGHVTADKCRTSELASGKVDPGKIDSEQVGVGKIQTGILFLMRAAFDLFHIMSIAFWSFLFRIISSLHCKSTALFLL